MLLRRAQFDSGGAGASDGWSCALAPTGRRVVAWHSGEVRAALREIEESIANLGLQQRWVGYIAYEAAGAFEELSFRHDAAEGDARPLVWFELCDVVRGSEAGGERWEPPARSPLHDDGRARFEAMVERAIEYIGAGDVFQVNLSHALSVQSRASAGEIYQRLLTTHPTRYAALLDFGDWAVVSHSPELFLKVSEGVATTRPIKGTRPHGAEAELIASEKDQAELAMIVDLMRNDLGRVCEMGSVSVLRRREIEQHPAVVHAVATIEGRLAAGVGLERLIAATFPCGSVTGAPKIRAMQIIDELENYRRGVYCGSVGWIGRDERGGLATELNVAIRTMTVAGGWVTMPVGAGIVADSVPAEEWAETIAKAGAMLGAVGSADLQTVKP